MRILRKLSPPKGGGREYCYLALDVENASNETCPEQPDGRFLCASVAGEYWVIGSHTKPRSRRPVERTFDDQKEFCDFLASLPKNSCRIVTYNLSYDRWFFAPIVDDATVITVESRIICLTIRSNGLQVMDLYNHTMAGSLADWIKWVHMERDYGIVKLPLSRLEERNLMDARATWRLALFLEAFYRDQCGCPMRLTVGSTALRLFQLHFFTDYWYRDDFEAERLSEIERRAYYGGRVEVYRRGAQRTWAYDINSTYVSIMRDCLIPDPASARYVRHYGPHWRDYYNDYLGIYHVRVRIPASLSIPVLPYRSPEGKLIFPVGEIEGYWCSPELHLAEEMGCEIVECWDFIWYKNAKPYFRSFAEFIWAKRQEYKQSKTGGDASGMNSMVKRIGNSLYGKFAERHDADSYFGRMEDYDKPIPEGARVIDHEGIDYLSISSSIRVPAHHEFPVISAMITAYARIKLYREGLYPHRDTAIYADTDCVKLTSASTTLDVGNGLGQWGMESEDVLVTYYRPKFYGDKHKGVPKNAERIASTDDSETWRFDKPLRYREAIKRGDTPNRWVTVEKVLAYRDDKRVWHDQESIPLIVR